MAENQFRRRGGVFLGVAWLLLAAVTVVWGVRSEQSDLQERAQAALEAAGVDAAVDFEGRDAVISGPDEAASIVAAVRGVRAVRGPGGENALPPAASPSTTEPAPGTSVPEQPPATTPPTSTAPATTTTTTTTTLPATTTTTTAVPLGVAHFTARLEQGQMILTGAIPSAEAAAQVAVVADLIYFPFLSNELTVDPDLPPAPWLAGTPGSIAVLPITGTATLEVVGDTARLTGLAPTQQRRLQLEGAIQRALGDAVTITNDVEVTGKTPPFFTASAPGDGTVTVGGVMPDQAAIDRIVGSASQVFGPENVTTELVIGDDIDTTFSLFRIPLVFIQFAPIPQWQFQIEDDVITGNLRGGATFEFGSSNLTPELEALLDTAGGILLRNPSIFITIEGHTDSVGSNSSNQALSERRAQSAADYLVALGIDPARLAAVGYGEERPIADNGTSEGRAQNRRVEFALGPPSQ